MRAIALPVMAFIGLFAAHVSAGALSARDHPILGSWRMTTADGSCSETYRFRSDGTVFVTSGEEVAEIEYEISSTASAKGFYRWAQRLVKDNGKKDCAGKVSQSGEVVTWFVQFDPSRERMIVCKAESTQACFGPLRRVHGSDS